MERFLDITERTIDITVQVLLAFFEVVVIVAFACAVAFWAFDLSGAIRP